MSEPIRPETADTGNVELHPRDRGRFTAGNQEARTHGLHSSRLPAEVMALVEEASAFAERSMADAGGRDQLTTREQSLHQYRGLLNLQIQQMHLAITTRGLFDRRGKLRVAWITKLESLISSARGIDALLGLQRQAKRVPSLTEVMHGPSLADVMAGRAAGGG